MSGEVHQISKDIGVLTEAVNNLKSAYATDSFKSDGFRKTVHEALEEMRSVQKDVIALQAETIKMKNESAAIKENVAAISAWRWRVVGGYGVLTVIGAFFVTNFKAIVSTLSGGQ